MHLTFPYWYRLTKRFCVGLIVLLVTIGCGQQEESRTVAHKGVPRVFADYRVWASEGDSMATCRLQFFTDPQKRQSLWLTAPAAVSIDQVQLEGDSTRMMGAFYEYQQPLPEFGGSHTVVFRHADGRVFEDSFYLPVFDLAAELPEVLPAADLSIRLTGIRDGTPLRVVLTDTALAGVEYNELHNVAGDEVLLRGTDLARLHRGPVVLHLAAETDRPLAGSLPGTLSVSYSLTRSFRLR